MITRSYINGRIQSLEKSPWTATYTVFFSTISTWDMTTIIYISILIILVILFSQSYILTKQSLFLFHFNPMKPIIFIKVFLTSFNRDLKRLCQLALLILLLFGLENWSKRRILKDLKNETVYFLQNWTWI